MKLVISGYLPQSGDLRLVIEPDEELDKLLVNVAKWLELASKPIVFYDPPKPQQDL